MKKVKIALSSVTYAMKAKRYLWQNGIKTKLIRLEAAASQLGCTHGLELDASLFLDAAMHLRQAGYNYSLLNEGK